MLLALAIAAPKLLSTSWGRSFALYRLNRQLGDKLAVDSLSIGWASGLEMHGLRVGTPGHPILQVAKLSTELSLFDLLRGQTLDLGKTDARHVTFVLHRYADGSTNLSRLLASVKPEDKAFSVQADFAGDVQGRIEVESPDGTVNSVELEKSNVELAWLFRRGTAGLEQLEISILEASFPDLDISLDEPIIIQRSSGRISASGAGQLSGRIDVASRLLDAFGLAHPDWQLGGTYSSTQRLTTEDGALCLVGETHGELIVGPEDHPRCRQKLRIANDLGLSLKDDSLAIRRAFVDLPQSRFSLTLQGTIRDAFGQGKFENMRGLITCDAERLPPLVGRMIGGNTEKELARLSLYGLMYERPFTITGQYPRPRRSATDKHPLDYFAVRGSLLFDNVDYHGLHATSLELPLDLSGGHLRSIFPDRAPAAQLAAPAACNGGFVQLSGLDLDFTSGPVRLSTLRPDLKVLDNVRGNEDFIAFLGRLMPLFHNIEKADAVIDLVAHECASLPLTRAIQDPADPGRLRLSFSMRDLSLRSWMISTLASELQMKLNENGQVPGDVRNATIEIRNGRCLTNLNLNLGGQTIGFRDGESILADKRIVKLTLIIPAEMIPLLGGRLKGMIEVPITGFTNKPQVDLKAIMKRKAMDLLTRPSGG